MSSLLKYMLPEKTFLKMKNKYGDVGSWALWKKEGDSPKSNMDAVDLFDIQKNPSFPKILHNKSILVGLNFSRTALNNTVFSNFHDPRPQSQDYKLRFALENTSLIGSYMTDIFKNEIEVKLFGILTREKSNNLYFKQPSLQNLSLVLELDQ